MYIRKFSFTLARKGRRYYYKLNLGEDEDCTDSLSPEELNSLFPNCLTSQRTFKKSIEGTEDSDQELQPITLEFRLRTLLKALDIVSTLLDESNRQDRIACTAISLKQL